ncbi:MAG: C2 family cysteine protease [Planctomycetota bacterium]
MSVLLLLALFVAQDPAASGASVPAPKPRTFAEVTRTCFAAWDRDGDGTLQPLEIDALCVRADTVGEEAAAIASLKRVIRSGKYAVPPLTVAELTKARPSPAGRTRARPPAADAAAAGDAARAGASDTDRSDSPEPSPTSGPSAPALRQPNFQSSFANSLRRIRSTKRELFVDPTPDLDACRQGPLGDCFLVAAVGAMVARDPLELMRRVEPKAEGGYVVHFGNGRTVEVAPLTDAELALSGTTGDEGLWLPVLEKAIGSLRQELDPAKYATDTATDAISKGGSTASMIRLLTGHTTVRIGLEKRPKSTEKDQSGNAVLQPSQPAGDHEALAARVRTEVAAALRAGRLVASSTRQEAQPKGISGKHAYAVLAFDAATDELHLWNPHGNTHRPKGDKGLQNGYPTKAGRFSMPVADFVRVFSSVVIETAESLPRVDPRKPVPAPSSDGKKVDRK